MHDCRDHFIDPVPDRLYRLSRPCRREVIRLPRLAGGGLLSDTRFTRSPRLRHPAASDPYAHPRLRATVGPTSAHRPMDDADLALCLGNRRSRVPDALQMVSSLQCCAWPLVNVC